MSNMVTNLYNLIERTKIKVFYINQDTFPLNYLNLKNIYI